MNLIDKDKIKVEIEKKTHGEQGYSSGDAECGYMDCARDILSFLDTIEVKEVDLDKETTHYLLYEHRSPLNEIMHKADLKSEMQYHKDIENAFKAGFKLGIKAQKGE